MDFFSRSVAAPPLAACSTDAVTLAPMPAAATASVVCEATNGAAASSLPAAAANAALSAAAAAVATAATAAPPWPSPPPLQARPTLASTAKLFLPDQSSPILLAPSESEIHSDPRYYALGAQLVAALVLFSLAYTVAYVLLGWVRRREARVKAALREAIRERAERVGQQRLQGRRGDSGGGGGVVRPRLYTVQPASSSASRLILRPSISLELSDLTPHPTALQRLHRRVRHTLDWILSWPTRWRRRRRAKAKALQLALQQQQHRARRSSVSEGVKQAAPAAAEPPMIVSKARRMSTSIAAFLSRSSPSAALHPSASDAAAARQHHRGGIRRPGSDSTSVHAPSSPLSPAPSAEQLDREASFASSLLLGAFSTPLPLPWLTDEGTEAEALRAEQAEAAAAARKRAPSSAFASWAAAYVGAGGGSESASPLSGNSVSPPVLSLLRTPSRFLQLSPLSPLSSSPAITAVLPPPQLLSPSPSPSRPLSPASSSSFGDPWLDGVGGDAGASSSSAGSSGLGAADFPEEENEREFLTYTLATFVLTVALLWLELLVLSVLASSSSSVALHGLAGMASSSPLGGVYALNELYLFSWCSKDFVTLLWTGTVWLSSLSLFVLGPFAFLYWEAEGILGRRGTLSRTCETLLVLTGFTVLLYGSFHLLHSLLDLATSTHIRDIPGSGGGGHDEAALAAAILPSSAWWTQLWAWVSWSASPSSAASSFAARGSSTSGGWFRLLFSGGWLDTFSFAALSSSSLYSNIWHFLPGLLILLLTSHRGCLDLISLAFARATEGGAGRPFQSLTLAQGQAKELRVNQQLNAIKCEIMTLRRKWEEMHEPALQQQQQTQLQGGVFSARRTSSGRAIAPIIDSSQHQSAALTRQAKSLLLGRLEALQVQYEACSGELRPQSTWGRMVSSPILKRGAWMIVGFIGVLLVWHIVLRVAQREARLIFRGSIFRWFRAAASSATDGDLRASAAQGWGASMASAGATLLGSMKTLLGTLLSVLTGRGLGDKTLSAAAGAASAGSSPLLVPSLPALPAPAPAPSWFSDSPFFSALWSFSRLLLSAFLGINGFHHPFAAFLADLALIAFFLLASARQVYASGSHALLARFSPVRAMEREMEQIKREGLQVAGAVARAGEGGAAAVAASNAAVSASSALPCGASAASASVAPSPPARASDSSTLLFSAQFFTLNVVLLLLLTSSLPIATWMLGLSSFDLLTFYPQAAGQLAAGAHGGSLGSAGGGGAAGGVSFFLHLYNLSFLALTIYHATQLSRQMLVWVVIEPMVRSVERIVERVRVWIGWSSPHARPEEKFMLFRSWRTRGVDGPPLSRMQMLRMVVVRLWNAARVVLAPVLRALAYLVHQAWRLLSWATVHAWTALTLFLEQELRDEEIDVQMLSPRASSEPPPSASSSPPAPSIELPEAAVLSSSAMESSESSLASQLLAEVDAASQAAASAAAAALAAISFAGSGSDESVFTSPAAANSAVSPSHRRTRARHGGTTTSAALFARAISAPSRLDVDAANEVLENAEELGQSADVEDNHVAPDEAASAGAPDLTVVLPTSHFSPLYAARARSASYMQTPVPGCSRRLTMTRVEAEAAAAAAAATAAASEGGDEVVTPSSGVSDADFPAFAPAPGSPFARIDEDGSLSANTSAAPTPQYSPLSTPARGVEVSASSCSASPSETHGRSLLLDGIPPFSLNDSTSGIGDNDTPSSPWTPASSSSASSQLSSASGTPSAASVRERLGWAAMASASSASALPVAGMRLEPMLEEVLDESMGSESAAASRSHSGDSSASSASSSSSGESDAVAPSSALATPVSTASDFAAVRTSPRRGAGRTHARQASHSTSSESAGED